MNGNSDMSDFLQKMVEVHCAALDCDYNSLKCSFGRSAGYCDRKHIGIKENGVCSGFMVTIKAPKKVGA